MPKPQNPLRASLTNVKGVRQIARIKAAEFSIESKFNTVGYRSREDYSILPPTTLVYPSVNVLTNQYGRVANRLGYTLYGQANVTNVSLMLQENGDFILQENGDVIII